MSRDTARSPVPAESTEDRLANPAVADLLLRASRAVLRHDRFEDCARVLFDFAREFTGARSGYVALMSDDGKENEVLFLEAGGLECTVSEDLPMPIRGLRAESYRLNQVVVENDFSQSRWMRFLPEGHVRLKNVAFAPLVIDGLTRGIVGLANKDGDFTEEDLEVAAVLGEYAAVSLRNARNLDQLRVAVDELDRRNRELTEAKQAIENLENTDPLTGTATRRYFDEILLQQTSLSRRHGLPLQMAMVDLDHFKVINDTHGHDVGDEVLAAVGSILRGGIRREDTVGRFGGEEFLVLFPNTTADAAFACVERLREEVEALRIPDVEVQVSISAGIAELREEDGKREFVARADAAMYVAKRKGRNRTEVA